MSAPSRICEIDGCPRPLTETLGGVWLCRAHYQRILAAARLKRHTLGLARNGQPRDCVVYFARLGDYIKIGRSTDVPGRLVALRGSAGVKRPVDLPSGPLTLLATMPAIQVDERIIHDHFASARVVGEWFRATPELIDYVASLTESAASA